MKTLLATAFGVLASTQSASAPQASSPKAVQGSSLTVTQPTGSTRGADRRLLLLSAQEDIALQGSTQYTVYPYEGDAFTIAGLGPGCDYAPPDTAVFSLLKNTWSEGRTEIVCWDNEARDQKPVEGEVYVLGPRTIVVGPPNMSYCQPTQANLTFDVSASKVESTKLPCYSDKSEYIRSASIGGAVGVLGLGIGCGAVAYSAWKLRDTRAHEMARAAVELEIMPPPTANNAVVLHIQDETVGPA